MLFVDTFSWLKSLLGFTNRNDSKAIFKTHMAWSTLTFLRKGKTLVFETSTTNFLFGKLVIIRILFHFENCFFSDKHKKFFRLENWLFLRLSAKNLSMRNFLGRNLFLWVGQVSGPGELIINHYNIQISICRC